MSPRRRDATTTREAIVTAASQAFAERGYSGVTVRDIAAAADVDPALVVRYFGSKAALFALSLGAGGPLLSAALDGPLPAMPARVAEFLVAKPVVAAGAGDSALAALVLSVADPEGRALLAGLVGEHLETPLVQRLITDGVDPVDAHERARAVTTVILGQSLALSALSPPHLPTKRLSALLAAALGPL